MDRHIAEGRSGSHFDRHVIRRWGGCAVKFIHDIAVRSADIEPRCDTSGHPDLDCAV